MDIDKIRLGITTMIDLPLFGASPTDSFILKAVDGLGPPEINISMAPAVIGGNTFQGKKVTARQIVLLIKLNPNYGAGETVESLRTRLYGLLSDVSTSWDRLTFYVSKGSTDLARIYGWVSKFEMNPFSKEPEVQVTIDCEEAYFEAPTQTTFVPTSTDGKFTVYNPGTAPAPFELRFTLTAAISGTATLRILHDATFAKMEIQSPLLNGDKIIFVTTPKSRSIQAYRDPMNPSYYNSMLGQLNKYSSFFLMLPGNNGFTVTPAANIVWESLKFRPRYWGI